MKASVSVRGGLTQRQLGFLLVLPALCLLSFVNLYPLINSLFLGFTNASLIRPGMRWVGLANYFTLFRSPHFYHVLGNTAVFVVGATLLPFMFGFILALFLNQKIRARGFLRGVCLLPWVLAPVIVSFLWMWIFNAHYGILNGILRQLGIIDKPIAWLAKPSTAMFPIIIAKTWQSFPWFMSMLLAGLQTVPKEQAEAARIDGAGDWVVLKHVIWPHMRLIIGTVILLGTIWNLQHFDIIWIMTEGGPCKATTTLSIEVYKRTFFLWDLGTAGALGSVWMAVVVVFVWSYLKLSGFTETGVD